MYLLEIFFFYLYFLVLVFEVVYIMRVYIISFHFILKCISMDEFGRVGSCDHFQSEDFHSYNNSAQNTVI